MSEIQPIDVMEYVFGPQSPKKKEITYVELTDEEEGEGEVGDQQLELYEGYVCEAYNQEIGNHSDQDDIYNEDTDVIEDERESEKESEDESEDENENEENEENEEKDEPEPEPEEKQEPAQAEAVVQDQVSNGQSEPGPSQAAPADGKYKPIVVPMTFSDLKKVNPAFEYSSHSAYSMLTWGPNKCYFCEKRLTDQCRFLFFRLDEMYEHVSKAHPGEKVNILEIVGEHHR